MMNTYHHVVNESFDVVHFQRGLGKDNDRIQFDIHLKLNISGCVYEKDRKRASRSLERVNPPSGRVSLLTADRISWMPKKR